MLATSLYIYLHQTAIKPPGADAPTPNRPNAPTLAADGERRQGRLAGGLRQNCPSPGRTIVGVSRAGIPRGATTVKHGKNRSMACTGRALPFLACAPFRTCLS